MESFSGDIVLQFRCSPQNYVMVGLSKNNECNHYRSIDCALYCNHGRVTSYESGTYQRWKGLKYDETSMLAVRRRNDQVDFVKDGQVLRRCSKKLTGDVLADVSAYYQDKGGVLDAQWNPKPSPPPPPGPPGARATPKAQVAVVWRALSCVETGDKGKLVKSECGHAWNAGAISTFIAPIRF